MSWAAHRTTTIKEDKVYCLLGIFGVFLPLIYGEGEAHAAKRLKEQIQTRQDETPRPSRVLPFRRDPDFVNRGTLLNELQEKCSPPASRVALVGLGGVGKSQLAIEHCYRAAEQSLERWVFWVHASNAARFEQSFRDIADSVKIEGRRDPQTNIFKLVHDWLRDSKNPWLLVLDNVDDARFLLGTPTGNQGQPTHDSRTASRPLREYLPHCECGSIVITTRNEEAALKLVERRDIIAVEPMDKEQALALLQKKLEEQQSCSDLAGLAAALEYMPLAIVQAAAYIKQRAPRCSVAKYLDEFRKSERKRLSLLSHENNELRRDWEAKHSIIVTWQISFEYIQQIRPSAADLLSLMSFFDRQGIPEALLQRLRDHDNDERDSDAEDDASQSSASEEEFEHDVVTLRNFHFISVDPTGTSFEMHALVQLATRKWLAASGKLEHWKGRFISNLCAVFPGGDFENWAVCQTLFAHAKSAAEQQPEEESSQTELATLLYRAAWYATEKGNIADAITLAKKSMRLQMKVLGEEHEDTLWSMAMVGKAYRLGGCWDDAEKLDLQVLGSSKKKLGQKHSSTLTLMSMANLAMTYNGQGRWDEAEELEVQVMETRKQKLGVDHPYTLTSMNNLASTYSDQGRWANAEELEVQVLEARKKKLGVDDPDTLTSMNNLATTYMSQGRWDDAEELQVQVIETLKEKLGADHPQTLISINNLATTYWNQGRWDDAEELEVQALETRKKKFGADHPDTLINMNNLASVYWDQGRWDEAEELEVQVLKTRKKKLGVDHPNTLTSMHNLAFTCKSLGRTTEAICLMRECVKLSQQVLRVDHPYLISSSAYLARWEAERVVVNAKVEPEEGCS
ncbi:hypothetical protein FB567DRAFT_430684 [Paraphoma chrysanthemicola]|uniref:Kinesin light chain n=1 Tax=Paraphoma chrysanthemicola TaxID=798071 RepID=A0A8K0RJ96_9PLEO|nr:hypothetical protein FB567DRAFT_430684 [Paraphoma chrysanthemicola]